MKEEQQEQEHQGRHQYLNMGLTAFGVIAAAMLLFFCLFRLEDIFGLVKRVIVILKPFIYGIVIAYLLNPIYGRLYKWLHRLLKKPFGKHEKQCHSMAQILSSLLSVVLLIAMVYALLALILPELYGSILNFANNLSPNLKAVEQWLKKFLAQYPDIENTVLSYYDTLTDMVLDWLSNTFLPGASTMFNAVTNGLGSMLTFFYNLLIGVIVAVYLLNGKEVLLPQCRKLLFGVLRYDHADAVLKECAYANQMFSGFVYGKIVDSLIVGMIYFIVGTLLRIPYVAMISVIVGVTNVIPFFGPYIGAIPSAVILLLTNPLACLKFVIAIVIIQQFDGNFLGPKILGNTTGLSSYWVLFSILLFGGLFGFAGMLIGVPLFAVIYHIVKSRVEYLLGKKGLPVESSAYAVLPKEPQKETRFFETWKKREGKKNEQDQ
jgi:predicted PurR-regulated permease PerM